MTFRLGGEGWAGLPQQLVGGRVGNRHQQTKVLRGSLGDDHNRKSVRVRGRGEGFHQASWGTRSSQLWLRPVKARVPAYINSGMSV